MVKIDQCGMTRAPSGGKYLASIMRRSLVDRRDRMCTITLFLPFRCSSNTFNKALKQSASSLPPLLTRQPKKSLYVDVDGEFREWSQQIACNKIWVKLPLINTNISPMLFILLEVCGFSIGLSGSPKTFHTTVKD